MTASVAIVRARAWSVTVIVGERLLDQDGDNCRCREQNLRWRFDLFVAFVFRLGFGWRGNRNSLRGYPAAPCGDRMFDQDPVTASLVFDYEQAIVDTIDDRGGRYRLTANRHFVTPYPDVLPSRLRRRSRRLFGRKCGSRWARRSGLDDRRDFGAGRLRGFAAEEPSNQSNAAGNEQE